MKYLTFTKDEKPTYKICILVNEIKKDEIEKYYIEPYGLNKEDIIIISLHQIGKKTPMKIMRQYITDELAEVLENLQVEYLIIGDAEYFKAFTKSAKADRMIGYVIDSTYGTYKCIYIPNYRTMFYDPDKITTKIGQGIKALKQFMGGTYSDPGLDIIEFYEYPESLADISDWLQRLLAMDIPLSIDIEAFSLRHYHAGIGTICFAWSKTEGIAIPIDICNSESHSYECRELLREFFIEFTNKALYHHISYDVMVLIYQLFMKHLLDTEGLLNGLEIMLRNWDDTKLISYLATNSCAGNHLSLKDQAQEYAGNYAQEDIKDITKIPLPQLLQYNLIDGLSTHFVYEKHWDTLVQDNQLDIYENIFKPAIVDIIQMQLTGMPLDMERVKEVKAILQADNDAAVDRMQSNPLVQKFVYEKKEQWVIDRNETLKVKRVTIEDADLGAKPVIFNPNSNPDLCKLIYEDIGLPILDKAKSGGPSTKGKAFEKLINYTTDPDVKDLLQRLIDYKAVNKILTAFIPAFEEAQLGPDGWYYLFGNFNLGGTVSGRLSSSEPNLQNLPATASKYAKLIKSCFRAPPGWLFCGVDFNGLEDRISALTTKDPNKLKVFTDGYDGHCLRAQAYFGTQMPDIDPNSVDSINSIQDKYKDLRQKGKNPTFALTYQGTFSTLMRNYNFTMELAKDLEFKYNSLYIISVNWVKAKLEQACKDGYVTVAFGLRVRTPLLHQVIRGTKSTPSSAEAEGRTAGNALGQSYGLLNSRSASAFMKIVRKEDYRLDIRPCAQIHDAQYYLIRDDLNCIAYANDNLIREVEWQELPEIAHDEVKLGGKLGIFYPNWSKEIEIPNYASPRQIEEAIQDHYSKEAAKKAA